MGGPISSIRYRQHSSWDHVTTQTPTLRQSRDTFGGDRLSIQVGNGEEKRAQFADTGKKLTCRLSFIYSADCTMFPRLPAPIKQFDHYIIFFLQLFLSFQSSSINPFSPISPLIPSIQVSLGLPRFLLPGGRHFITSYGNLPSSILWTVHTAN
jgi:hypothetical protein